MRELASVDYLPTDFVDYDDRSRWQVNITESGEENTAAEIAKNETLNLIKAGLPLDPSVYAEKVNELLSQTPYIPANNIPVKLTVTEMKRRFENENEALVGTSFASFATKGDGEKPIFTD